MYVPSTQQEWCTINNYVCLFYWPQNVIRPYLPEYNEIFLLYFCIWKMMGCLTLTHKIKRSVYRDFSENWIKGVVLFLGKRYTIIVLYYYYNIQLCLAYEYTKHKQLKTTSDMHMEQSTWSKWSYQYTKFPESLIKVSTTTITHIYQHSSTLLLESMTYNSVKVKKYLHQFYSIRLHSDI